MNDSFENYLLKKSKVQNVPIRGTLELTPLCNMNCRMCYVHENHVHKQQLKTAEFWIGLIDEMKTMGTLFIGIIGGEPFVYPDLENVYRAYIDSGFLLNLTTNGIALSDGIPQWLQQQKPRYLTISLYGASDLTYKKITGKSNGFTLAMRALEHVKAAEIPVKINHICLPENIDDLGEILNIAESYDCPIVIDNYCYPNNSRRNDCEYERLSPPLSANAYWDIFEKQHPEHYKNWLDFVAAGNYGQGKNTNVFTCNAGKSSFWIDWKGKINSCGLISDYGVDITEHKLSDAWKILVEKTNSYRLCQECSECDKREICSVCPARMIAETGSFSGKPEYVCKITDEIIKTAKERIVL